MNEQNSVGSYKRIDAKATNNLPLTATLHLRISAASLNRGGNVLRTAYDLGRVQLRWKPAQG